MLVCLSGNESVKDLYWLVFLGKTLAQAITGSVLLSEYLWHRPLQVVCYSGNISGAGHYRLVCLCGSNSVTCLYMLVFLGKTWRRPLQISVLLWK